MNDLQKWIRIRKDLYLQMERQVRHRLGEDTEELLRYRQVYNKEFSKKWTPTTKEDLWGQIEKSSILLMGDFHALHQSQKAQLRILRHLVPGRQVVLAVEFFEAEDQDKIDQFVSGRLSEKDFLKAVQWRTKWGFPWEHYRPLLRWAQKHKVPVYGLNKSYKKRNASTLKSRDIFAGKKIAGLVKQYPQHLVAAIYGDLHLAVSHIPDQIENILGKNSAQKTVRLFQNSEQIYFQLLNRELEASTDLVRLSRNAFCLMSVPPWVKWQNYLMYLEQAYDVGLGDDDDDSLDHTDHVSGYVKIMAEELGVSVSVAGLSVYTAEDASFWSQVKEHYDPKRQKWIQGMIAEEMSFYLPEIKAAYLARATVNHAAALAMRFLHAELSSAQRTLADLPKDFLGLIWLEAMAYFGSKMINHKRKTDTIADIKASLASRSSGGRAKEALQLALSQKMHELMVITGVSRQQLATTPRRKESYLSAASLLGGMLGERLYTGYRKKMVSTATVRDFLSKSVESDHFQAVYYDLLEVVEALPVSFHSKREKL